MQTGAYAGSDNITAGIMLVLKKPLPAIAAGIVVAALFRQL